MATFIQSGNVLFEAGSADTAKLTAEVEKLLSKTFNYKSRVVLISHGDMKKIVSGAPKGFGGEPTKYRYMVIFLKEPLTAKEALEQVPVKENVDQVWAGTGALYHTRLESKATQSRLNRVVGTPIYQNMTLRNWNTTTKLLAMMDKRAES